MENCLVTKLKGSVDNDNLIKLGYIRVVQELDDAGKNNNFTFSKDATIYFENCTYKGSRQLNFFAGYSKSINNENIVLDSGETIARYQVPLYTIAIANFGTMQEIDCDRIIYADGKSDSFNSVLRFWSSVKFIGDTDKMIHTNLFLHLNNYNSGEIIDVTDMGLQGNAACFFFYGTNFKGSLDNMGFVIGQLSNNLRVPNNKNVSLNVETFVRNAVSAGNTSDNLTCSWLGASTTTFKGAPITSVAENTLAWEPYGTNQTKITLTVGGTTDTEIIDN